MSEANLSIIPFQFEGKPIRVVEQDGELWFVAADVCRVLELDNVAMAVRVLDPDEKGVNTFDTPGGSQQMTVISEPGVYKLLGRSRKPEARRIMGGLRWFFCRVGDNPQCAGKPFRINLVEIINQALVRAILFKRPFQPRYNFSGGTSF